MLVRLARTHHLDVKEEQEASRAHSALDDVSREPGEESRLSQLDQELPGLARLEAMNFPAVN